MAERLKSTLLSRPDRIRHGFFTRNGGVSEGIYHSLNCGPGSGDIRAHVEENRRRVAEALGARHLCTNYQVHSDRVVTLEAPFDGPPPEADGLVSNRPGLALGILTADCAPVLFCDSEAGVIGAAHAGWKGLLAGILERCIEAMEALGATRRRLFCALGPAIAQESYEVGDDLREQFLTVTPADAVHFIAGENDGRFQFDLAGAAIARLLRAGVEEIEDLSLDTYAEEDFFFSYRRATHRGEADYGRQVSAIMIADR